MSIKRTTRGLARAVLVGAGVATLAISASAQSKPTAKKPTTQKPPSPWKTTDALVRDKLGTNGPWQVAGVQTNADGVMRVVLKDSAVSESQYQTMVLTTCYHLTQPRAPKKPKEIAFLNVHERTGYVFEAPDRCGEFLKMPVGKVKTSLLGVTHLFDPGTARFVLRGVRRMRDSECHASA
jgi:hypothetical protein